MADRTKATSRKIEKRPLEKNAGLSSKAISAHSDGVYDSDGSREDGEISDGESDASVVEILNSSDESNQTYSSKASDERTAHTNYEGCADTLKSSTVLSKTIFEFIQIASYD